MSFLSKISNHKISVNHLLLIVCGFIITFDNLIFWGKLSDRISIFETDHFRFYLAIFALIFVILYLLLVLCSNKYTLKIFVSVILIITAIVAYFSKIGVVFDQFMIANIVDNIKENNTNEALELLSVPLIIHLSIFAFVPIILLWAVKVKHQRFLTESKNRVLGITTVIIVAVIMIWSNMQYLTYFGRENRDLRYFSNPLYIVYSSIAYVSNTYFPKKKEAFKVIGDDALIDKTKAQKTVGIFIVGETARADRFSLNGYHKTTNPNLEKQKIINFSNVASCGTSTAYSVPCMFSMLNKNNYSPAKANNQSNVLDILQKAGVKVFWLDNNSSCKGVCVRVEFKNMLNQGKFDSAMLDDLKTYIDQQKTDTLIVLHSLGSHGPRYYKRYPKQFESFTPVCKNTPEKCDNTEINNTYDNTILYTDYFINEAIQLVKNNYKNGFVFYASDHGESLGENGVYLHGLPYIIAPKAQTHVPMLAWISNKKSENSKNIDTELSHDNISHSLLGLFNVKTKVYNKKLDLFR